MALPIGFPFTGFFALALLVAGKPKGGKGAKGSPDGQKVGNKVGTKTFGSLLHDESSNQCFFVIEKNIQLK